LVFCPLVGVDGTRSMAGKDEATMAERVNRPGKNKRKRIILIAYLALINPVIVILLLERFAFRGSGFPPPHLITPGLFSSSRPSQPGSWALLINGGVSPKKNYGRYWNNISLMAGTLKSLGWENIFVLNADGLSPEPDQLKHAFLGYLRTGGIQDSPTDLDLDGRPDIQAAATKAEMEKTMSVIGQRMKPGDSLFLFITDHGKLGRFSGRIQPYAGLWGDTLTGPELRQMLARNIPASSWVTIMAAQCWGKMFLDKVIRPNTLFITPARPNWIWSDQDYSVFPYHFCEALLGKKPKSGDPVEADRNADGRVTFREAFAYARKNDHAPEWPVLWVIGDPAKMPDWF